MLSEKATAEDLDEHNQKIPQKIIGKFLYYTRSMDLTMLNSLKYLAAVQTHLTIETAKKFTQFVNYSATHPDSITEKAE